MSIRKLVNLVVVAALFPMAAQAAPLTYNVNRTIGAGTVIGTITTDGTFGSLTNANINAWSLTLDSSLWPLTLLTQANSFVLAASSDAAVGRYRFDRFQFRLHRHRLFWFRS